MAVDKPTKHNSVTMPKSTANGIERGVLTTGDVAWLCRVAPRTVSKWCDGGHLKSYRIYSATSEGGDNISKGGGDRRVEVRDLRTFLKKHRMPIHHTLTVKQIILAVGVPKFEVDSQRYQSCQLIHCESLVTATISIIEMMPRIAILGCSLGSDTVRKLGDLVLTKNPVAKVVIVVGDDGIPEALKNLQLGSPSVFFYLDSYGWNSILEDIGLADSDREWEEVK